jgi:hypothetical protein
VKINPFGLPNWVGNIKTTPYADYWYDNETRPIVKSNEGQNDAWLIGRINDKNGHGSQWNDWESIWTGISVELTDVESRKNVEFFAKTREKQTSDDSRKRWYSKEDIGTFTEPLEIVRKDYVSDFRRTKDYYTVAENTILNKSILPKMRTKTVTFNVYNMKPNTQVHAFFDNINVNQYCTYQGSTGPFTTSATDGSLIGIQFSIPSGMFECGEKIFRLTDDANNSIEDATTIAESVFYATGVKPDNRFNVSSIRPVEIRKQTPNSNKVVSNPLFKNKSINTTKYNQWIDPLAQTFEISEGDYPNGLYLDSIDLHFSSKDSSLPVTVEICPTVNGVPHSSVILPFSTVVKSASSVNANSTTPVPTNFKFSTPVYLAPGGYSLVVRTNSPKYSLYVGDIGELDLVTEERISSTFNGGVLYTANNSSQASAVSNKDLMFCLNKCKFKTSPNSVALNFVGQGTTQIVQVVQSNAYLFVSPNISLNTQLTLDVQNYSTANGRNVHLPQSFTINDSSTMNIVANISDTSGGDGTFMIDMDRTNVVAVGYVINSSDSSFSNEITPFSGIADDDTARYITRQIRLPDGETARELAVIFDTNYPQDTWIRVYGKMYNAKQRDFPVELEPYERLTVQPDSGFFDVLSQSLQRATNPNDFREMKYQNFPNRTEDFDTFAVKICLFTSNKANVPVIKNLRVVALK